MTPLLLVSTRGFSELPAVIVEAARDYPWLAEVRCIEGDDDSGVRSVMSAASSLARAAAQSKPIVVFFGSGVWQRRAVWALAAAGLLAEFRLAIHIPGTSLPLPASRADLFSVANLIVTDSHVAAQSIAAVANESRVPKLPRVSVVAPIIPGGVPVESSRLRKVARRDWLALRPDTLLVGCASQAPVSRFLAMHIFRVFAGGFYSSCSACGALTTYPIGDDFECIPTSSCSRCLAVNGMQGRSWAAARLLLIDGVTHAARAETGFGSWTMRDLRRRLNLDGQVLIPGEDGIPAAESREVLHRYLACLDIHLAPSDRADVPASVLATCAMGVPTITLRFGAAEELLGASARLVAPTMTLDDSAGDETALMDVSGAVRELVHLAGDADARAAFGASGRVAMRYDERTIGSRWIEHLEALAVS